MSFFPNSRDDAVNGMAWMRGETGDQGLNSLNFQSANMLLWMQQRVDPSWNWMWLVIGIISGHPPQRADIPTIKS
ncbi:hypothetical protein Hanom_Chr00s135310g01816941 [Helianthus anomalus]